MNKWHLIPVTAALAALSMPAAAVAELAEVNPTATPFVQLIWSRVADINGEAGAIESAEFSPDGQYIISGAKYDNSLILWRALDGTVVWRQVLDDEIERAGFSPDGEFVVSCGEDETLRLWRASDGEPIRAIALDAAVDGMAFSPDGKLMITGKEGGKVQAWTMPEMELVGTVQAPDTVNSIVFTQDGEYFFTAGAPQHVLMIRTNGLEVVRSFEGKPNETGISVRLAEDFGLVAMGQTGGYINVWNYESGEHTNQFNHTGQKVEAVEFSNDGRFLLYAGHTDQVRIVRTADFEMPVPPVAFTSQDAGRTEYLDFSPNGATMVSAHEDGTIRLWLWRSGDEDFNMKHHRSLRQQQDAAAEARAKERELSGQEVN
ncbi:MAG: WD40 repeat domain-containing protein [Lysobacterales bacterium]